jgi:hypothetical protein
LGPWADLRTRNQVVVIDTDADDRHALGVDECVNEARVRNNVGLVDDRHELAVVLAKPVEIVGAPSTLWPSGVDPSSSD